MRASVLPKVSARLGRSVTVNDVKVGFGTVEMRGLVVDGAGAAPPVVIPGLKRQGGARRRSCRGGCTSRSWSSIGRASTSCAASRETTTSPRSSTSCASKREADGESAGGGGGRLHVALVRIHEGNVRLDRRHARAGELKALDGDLRPDGPATLHVRGARLEAFGARAGADEATDRRARWRTASRSGCRRSTCRTAR